MSDARPVYEQIDSIASFLKQGGPRKIAMRELMELSLFLRRNKMELEQRQTVPSDAELDALMPDPEEKGESWRDEYGYEEWDYNFSKTQVRQSMRAVLALVGEGTPSTPAPAVPLPSPGDDKTHIPGVHQMPAAQEQHSVAGADAVDAKVSDDTIDQLLHDLNNYARGVSLDDYGLPILGSNWGSMREIVRAAISQSAAAVPPVQAKEQK